MSINSFDIAFRSVEIPTSLGTVCGICLSYHNRKGAESFFTYIHEYLSSPGFIPKMFVDVVAGVDPDGLYLLVIQVGFGETIRRVEIKGVDPKYILELKESLKIFKYYLLLAGYQADDHHFVLLPIESHHLLINNIEIDHIQYSGNPDCTFSWDELIQSKYIVAVE